MGLAEAESGPAFTKKQKGKGKATPELGCGPRLSKQNSRIRPRFSPRFSKFIREIRKRMQFAWSVSTSRLVLAVGFSVIRFSCLASHNRENRISATGGVPKTLRRTSVYASRIESGGFCRDAFIRGPCFDWSVA